MADLVIKFNFHKPFKYELVRILIFIFFITAISNQVAAQQNCEYDSISNLFKSNNQFCNGIQSDTLKDGTILLRFFSNGNLKNEIYLDKNGTINTENIYDCFENKIYLNFLKGQLGNLNINLSDSIYIGIKTSMCEYPEISFIQTQNNIINICFSDKFYSGFLRADLMNKKKIIFKIFDNRNNKVAVKAIFKSLKSVPANDLFRYKSDFIYKNLYSVGPDIEFCDGKVVTKRFYRYGYLIKENHYLNGKVISVKNYNSTGEFIKETKY